MSFPKKIVGFLAVFAVIPAAISVTRNGDNVSRVSVASTASARMPTMTALLNGTSSSTLATTTATSLADASCIESYTDCIKGGEACGTDFEECTNKTLFFAKKIVCSSVLSQCKATGINQLFGTSATTALATKNTAGEYVYPTDASILGQLITAGYINNRYDTSQCVKKYSSCLKKDDVCGNDFELCTTNTEFRKQKLFCESTLARCQNEGKTELFGSTVTTGNPTADSRLGVMISEGAALAAVNAVATCYKIADACILNTCATNPYKCTEGSNQNIVNIVETINNPDGTTTTTTTSTSEAVNASSIRGFIKNACFDTIGANKYCYATFLSDGAMPTNAQLKDEDNRDDIFSEAYSSRMNDLMRAKISDSLSAFDKKIKSRCSDTITSCAMGTCGGGSGAACFASAFNSELSPAELAKGVANANTLPDIRVGCSAVVNNDTACQYAGATFDTATGILDLLDDNTLFDTLFTSASDTSLTNPDPISVVSSLNAKLSTTYNTASLDKMKKQCAAVAQGCVKSMCGDDYSSCYRNRTDVYSNLTNSGDAGYNKSMNKVGGVLDNTIVIGLCLNTVKNNPTCEEHIKAEVAKTNTSDSTSTWTVNDTARTGWLASGTETANLTVQDTDANGNLLCTTGANNTGDTASCNDTSGLYIYPKMVSDGTYTLSQTTYNVFKDLIYDLEKEAQAKYNAKLTQQQNACLASNTGGGIMGSSDNGSTFAWVKLKNGKVPSDYAVAGLNPDKISSSNDIYNSFCRIRVTLQSDDKNIQDAISGGTEWGTAYFAAGDSFTCGSWIPNSELAAIADRVAAAKTGTTADGDLKSGQKWLTAGLTVLGAVGGGVGMNALQEKTGLGGLLGTTKDKSSYSAKPEDNDKILKCRESFNNAATTLSEVKAGQDGTFTNGTLIASGVGTPAYTIVFKKTANIGVADLAKLQKDVEDAQAAVDAAKKKNETATAEEKALTEAKKALEKGENIEKKRDDAIKLNTENMNKACGYLSTEDGRGGWEKNGKTVMNIVGAGIGGAIVGVGSAQIMKSSNRANFTAAQQEWMDAVGGKIKCYIGSEEVGEYSDIISTEME